MEPRQSQNSSVDVISISPSITARQGDGDGKVIFFEGKGKLKKALET